MGKVPFEVISFVRDKLDLDLAKQNISPHQWAEAIRDVSLQLGWTEDEFDAELDRRWVFSSLS